MVATFIVGLSVFLSYDWALGGFRPDAAFTILFAVLVAGIVFIASRYTATRASPAGATGMRLCPGCGRSIPPDAVLCPYCGQRLS